MLLHALTTLLFSSHAIAAIQPNLNFTNNPIFIPQSTEGIIYPRHLELADGTTILTAWQKRLGSTGFVAPVYQTKDNGIHWELISTLEKEIPGEGFIVQPALTQLTQDIGDYKAGTILMSGAQWGNSSRIDLYASKDQARTWEWVSKVAESLEVGNIFEPFLLQYKGQLVVYYSDERDADHSQILSHQVTSDLKTWGTVVTDVEYPTKSDRPGMTVIAYIPPIDQWILVYEFGPRDPPVNWPVYYRLAKSPLEFEKSVGIPLTVKGGANTPSSSPYVVWTPHGGANGTILVAAGSSSSLFTNSHGGASEKWEEHKTLSRGGYAPSLQLPQADPNTVLIYAADGWNGFMERNASRISPPLSVTAVSLLELALT